MLVTIHWRHLTAGGLLLALAACGQAPAPLAVASGTPHPPSAATTPAATSPASPVMPTDSPALATSPPASPPASPLPSPSPSKAAVRGEFSPCPSPPPRHAALFSYDASGKLRWQLGVPVPGDTTGPVGPVRSGGTEYVAVGRILHAVRISDGVELWSHRYDDDAYGLWLGGGTLSLLYGQVSTHARLVGLDPVSGSTRWTVAIPGTGLFANQAPTNDGGLAWIREDGSLQVVDLSTGHVRWSHHLGLSPGLGVAGAVVVYAVHGRLLGYDTSSGALRWSAEVGAGHTVVSMAGDLAVTSPNGEGQGIPSSDVAVDTATGRVVWTFDRKHLASMVASGGGLVFLATYNPDRRLYAVDARSGALHWQVTTFVANDTVGIVAGPDLLLVEGGGIDFPGTRVVDRALADGHIRWQRSVSGSAVLGRPLTVVADEVVVQLLPATSTKPSQLTALAVADGTRRWSADVPMFAGSAPLVEADGALVAAEDPAYGCAL